MNLVFGRSKFFLPGLTFVLLSVFSSSCSIPNLEDSRCTEARNEVKKLYSQHFGGNMKNSPETISEIKQFLTPQLKAELAKNSSSNFDYFTQTEDYPKAFRIGECSVDESSGLVRLQIVLFWRDDVRSEQRELSVITKNIEGNWLVDGVKSEK